MGETPKCPYCGAGMELKYVCGEYFCLCAVCEATSPMGTSKEAALSAALHRAEPENKPLTLGEVQECCEKGIGYMPLWVEFRNTPDVSRWMPINLHDTVFNSETVSIYLKSIGDKYNVMWRCWPRKPTSEQMAAAELEE